MHAGGSSETVGVLPLKLSGYSRGMPALKSSSRISSASLASVTISAKAFEGRCPTPSHIPRDWTNLAPAVNRRLTLDIYSTNMTTRPTVTIAGADGTPSGSTHPLPAVFRSPIRPDIVQYVSLFTYHSHRNSG